MTIEGNTATYRRWFDEGCSQGNVDLADELYAPDYVTHAVRPGLPPTLEGLKIFIRALRDGMPDMSCPVEQVVAEGDRVAGHFALRGTHRGTLLGIPPTGNKVDVGVMVIARFNEDGKWAEDWVTLGPGRVVPAARRHPGTGRRVSREFEMTTTSMTTTDANKALVRRAIGYTHGDTADPAEIFAPGFVAHMPSRPPMDRATFEQFVAGFADGFPGYTHEVNDQVAQGDLVANRVTWQGTHTGEFAGVAATGRPITMEGINIFRVHDGRVVEQWAELDFFGLLQQIGAIPQP